MKECTWYVEPLNIQTNAIVAEHLQNLPGAALGEQLKCADGQLHNLWQCPSKVIDALANSASQKELKFRVFRRQGNGQIERAKFRERKKKTNR